MNADLVARRKRRVASLAALATMTGLLAACGGGGDGTSDAAGPGPDPTPTSSGRFVDGPVSGLRYACGGVTGTTDGLGQFDYASGASCTFSVGGVTIGSAAGAPLLTPVSLVTGASPGVANTAVTNIVRFLLSLDNDGDPDNGILISAEASAALGTGTLDFAAAGFATAAATLVGQAIPGRALVDATTAEAHLDLSLLGLYSGGYNCTYSGNGAVLGGVAISISNGVVTGSGTPSGSSDTFEVSGTITSSGAANLSAGTTSTGATFEGTFTTDGTAAGTGGSGTWDDPELGSGTWRCTHL